MPAKRKHPKSKKRALKPSQRVRFNFKELDDQPVETNFKFWLIHALHWHALLLALIAIMVVGHGFFNSSA